MGCHELILQEFSENIKQFTREECKLLVKEFRREIRILTADHKNRNRKI